MEGYYQKTIECSLKVDKYTVELVAHPLKVVFIDADSNDPVINGKATFNERTKSFDTKGRFETEKQAKEVDSLVKLFMLEHNIPFIEVDIEDAGRLNYILDYIELVNS